MKENRYLEYVDKIEKIKENSPKGGSLTYEQNLDDVGNYISTRFFSEKKKKIEQKDVDNALIFVSKGLNDIKRLKQELLQDEQMSDISKKLVLSYLNNIGLEYISFKKAIYLEAEKGGYQLDEYRRKKYNAQVIRLQTIMNGPRVSDEPKEVEDIIIQLWSLYSDNQDKITEEEQKVFQGFLDKFMPYARLELNGVSEKKAEKENTEILEKKIPLDKVKKIFETILEIMGVEGWKVLMGEEYNSVCVRFWEKEITIPAKEKEFTITRILGLIDHEIMTHLVRGDNAHKTNKAEGPNYSIVEEGVAKFNTQMATKDFDQLSQDMGLSHITTFVGENCNAEEFYEIMFIYKKLEGKSEEEAKAFAEKRTLRAKRCLSFKEKGATRKDVSYMRGLKYVLEKINTMGEEGFQNWMKDFYFAKLSSEDIKLVGELREDLGINDDELKAPLWIGKILYMKLVEKKFSLQEAQERDFRFKSVNEISFSTKRKIVEVLHMLEQE